MHNFHMNILLTIDAQKWSWPKNSVQYFLWMNESRNPNSIVWQMMPKLLCLKDTKNTYFFVFGFFLLFCRLVWSGFGELCRTLWRSVKMTFTIPKWGLGSLPVLLKTQNSIVGVRTPQGEVFFISLKSYWSVDVKNGLAWAIRTSAAQVMCKRRARNQSGSLTPDH
jgi:hypothetical protein